MDSQRGIVQGRSLGEGTVTYFQDGEIVEVLDFNITDNPVTPLKIDPILASLRLTATGEQANSRLDSTEVSLELISGLFFFQERTEVTVSVILSNGRRIVISDPSEIVLQSSNTSILSVSNNFVVAEGVGVAELNVSWVNCEMILASGSIEISVEFNEHRPTFANDTQAAGIIENAPLGAFITSVFADDLDFVRSDFSRRDTEYRFMDEASTHGGLFVLDQFTGVVSLNGPLDRETLDTYQIFIEATDRAQRQTEQEIVVPNNGVSGSGSGSNSGSGSILMPDETSPPSVVPSPQPADPADVITVSLSSYFKRHIKLKFS